MKLFALVVVAALAVSLAAWRPDALLLLLTGVALLFAGAFLIVGVGRTFEWLTQIVRR